MLPQANQQVMKERDKFAKIAAVTRSNLLYEEKSRRFIKFSYKAVVMTRFSFEVRTFDKMFALIHPEDIELVT
jgi:hypothetical protein